ncbi:glycogen/starch/alpha-glucan phosphorylase [Desulfitobacterium dichloroeliminans LMG P-21439]|uniref:Alpha-1,4 glucan phosphorylase n=1 Tax=Desulfitobacterium dichloroeliminans (strain LMG P-21439 / DCA1) TaxID=871963 RepID=L0FAG8_DESDL|nr:glycogen/starch/alpha-glucan phosphorylase [Desulfitobacterium dichloroeliminans]AGA69646.1 glycogen/starch/alpha-glucan phosphorylase [Desulfitobacterium dichloroeliminans LMG P-21439]
MFSDKNSFKDAYLEKYAEIKGKSIEEGTLWDKYHTLVVLLKEEISLCRAFTNYTADQKQPAKQVYYFSMEFLIGKLLNNYLINIGIQTIVHEGLAELNIDLQELIAQESDAGLGNGGLGRLAACFLDSMAFLGVVGHGNGIRYKYGLFEQKIVNGHQTEIADHWLKNGYPWETRKPDKAIVVKFKGNIRVERVQGRLIFHHENYEPVLAVPYDIPIFSYENPFLINNLRLWSAEPLSSELDLALFNQGNFTQALSYKSEVEAISYILYPEDSNHAGRELRLKQEYFFVAAGLGAIVRSYKKRNGTLKDFSQGVAIHINDTHPALCIPELMRIFIDEEGMDWEESWNITVDAISYTNHTIMPEALEKWPVSLLKNLLPRIYMIIEEIDRRFKEKLLRRFFNCEELLRSTPVMREGQICMANLAIIGSHSINGVARLHTEILKQHVFKDFHRIFGYKFTNLTNGVNHRRFLLTANPALSELVTEAIGPGWKTNANELKKLHNYQEDASFLEQLGKVKYQNKQRLALMIQEKQGIYLDPHSLYDVHVKRIHAYKRQLLNVFKVMDLYNRLQRDPEAVQGSYSFIFGGKAAPGYHYAKSIIKLIHDLAQKINKDQRMKEKLRVVFLENFNVSLAERIYPAADLSEQISTASKEASGTGNMKFMMNGALTLGTLDGANVEIKEAVGDEHIFIFGLTAGEVIEYNRNRSYKSWDEYHTNPRLKKILEQLNSNYLLENAQEFRAIYDSLLLYNDEFYVLKDFESYMRTFEEASKIYLNQDMWLKSSLHNIAESGVFSSDRTIREYAHQVWRARCRRIEEKEE